MHDEHVRLFVLIERIDSVRQRHARQKRADVLETALMSVKPLTELRAYKDHF